MGDEPRSDSPLITGRRVTRQSTRRVSSVDTEKENPYRKPTYQPQGNGNGESSNDSSRSNSSGNTTPSRGRSPKVSRGRQVTPPAATTPVNSAPSTPRGRTKAGSRGSTPKGLASKRPARPECLGSGGGGSRSKKKKKKNTYYNATEYHYGSDFEEEEEEEEEEESSEEDDDEEEEEEDPPSPSASSLPDEPEMEIDENSAAFALLRYTSASAPKPVFLPPWITTENLPNLNLPKSSEDLLIDKDLVIQALAVYEPLRRFSNLFRLTQFRFEEFCGAMSSADEQNVLLVEIHIQLLKALLREEDAQSTIFGPQELKDSIQSVFYFIDALTWPETLRAYLESDVNFKAPEIPPEYPFVSTEKRLEVLYTLINQLLVTTPIRETLVSEVIKHEDHCRACARLGELICCETCPAVYHLECIETAHKKDWDAGNPPEQWKCGICKKDELTGTADCISELESAGLLIRQEKIGYDRHGRKYWFMARRIFVESEDYKECWYYTTRKQLGELLYCLEGEKYEDELRSNIKYNKEEIERQMQVTEDLTRSAAAHKRTWLEIEDLAIDRLNEERVAIVEQEKAEREREIQEEADRLAKIEEEKQRAEEDKRKKEEDERRKIREERLAKRNEEKARMMEEGELAAINDLIREQELAEAAEREQEAAEAQKRADQEAERKEKEKEDSKATAEGDKSGDNGGELGADDKNTGDSSTSPTETEAAKKPTPKSTLAILIAQESERTTRLKSHPPFKLGQPPISYVNSYTSDPLALSKQQHQEERDRKRYTSHKFSLTTASDFKWFGSTHGNRDQLQQTLRATLLTLEAMLPTTLLHVNWSALRRSWMCNKDFKRMLLELVDCLRSCLFNPVWLDQAGHFHLKRTSLSEREEKKKFEKIDKKKADDEEERMRYAGLVKYTLPLKHQVFKQKGEEYRIHGQYGWIWHSKLRPNPPTYTSSKLTPLAAGPQKHVIQVKGEGGLVKTMLIEPSVYNKLMAKRDPGEPPGIRYDSVRLSDGRVVSYARYTRYKVENVERIVSEVVESLLEELEDVKPSIEESSSNDTEAGLSYPPRVNTTPIDVSRGLVIANRVQFPKIAYGAPICDGLLARRVRATVAEEKELLRKYGATGARSCYSYSCRSGSRVSTCYSPTCTPAKVSSFKQIRAEKHYTTGDTRLKIALKKGILPPRSSTTPGSGAGIGTSKPARISPTFATSQGRSPFVLARWEQRKLARSGGRTWTPPGFSTGKAWGPFPCARPNFKTAWFWRAVTGKGLGAMALQLRILWACVRWDDLQAKPPLEGRSQVTTDTEIITNEILGHRIVGRFMERVQYLRKKHIVPLDDAAPSVKTVVVKDTSPGTPSSSRHGLRKRKRLQSPSSPNPSVLEEWVDEDKLELWEIRYYGERKQTRARSGLTPNRPEKFDPSPVNTPPARETGAGGTKRILNHAAVAEVLDNKVQHISKRNHSRNDKEADAKDTATPKEPTASELLQQSIAARAFCTPEAAKVAAKSVAGRKFFVSKAKETLKAATAGPSTPTTPVSASTVTTSGTGIMTNINLTSAVTGQTTRLTVFKGDDGRLQIKGLLPGQHCYQTADGRLHIVGSPNPTPSRLVLPSEQEKAVPVPMVFGTTVPNPNPNPTFTTPTPSTPRSMATTPGPAQLPTPRLVSVANAGQPRLVSLTSTAPRLITPTNAQPRQTGVSVPGLQQQQRVLVTNAAGQQQIILTGGQQIVIRSQAPVQQQQQMLPISIVSPSKQQQPQQQQFRVVVGSDGVQYFQPTGAAASPSPATTPTQPPTMNLVRRQIQLPSGQIVQVQVNEPRTTPTSGPVYATKSPAGTSTSTPPLVPTTTIPHPATLSLQRPPLVLRLPPPPALVPPSSASNIAAQQQQRPLILRRLMRPVTPAQLAELQMRGLVQVRPQSPTTSVSVGASASTPSGTVPVAMSPIATASSQHMAGLKPELRTPTATPPSTPSTPRAVVQPVRMDTPPPVIIGLEKPASSDNSPAASVASRSPVKTPQSQSPVKTPVKDVPSSPLPPPPAIIGLDFKIPDTTPQKTPEKSPEKPKSEPLKTTPPQINLPPLPPPPEIPLPPPSAVSTTPTSPAKKVSRRKAVHTPYLEMKPTTPTGFTTGGSIQSRPTGLTQEQRSLLFTHKENLKQDIMTKRALLEATLQRQIQLEMAALKPATPPKAQAEQTTKYTCSCGKPISGGQFYVSCAGGCTQFFHGSCVDITKQDLNQGKVYTCDKCKDDNDSEDELEIATPPPAKKGRGRKKGRSSGGSVRSATSTTAATTNANTSKDGDKELYCLCKQPYDDSHFYIGCDDCDDWFHGRCVGVLPVEGSSIADYKCPNCSPRAPFNRANFKELTPNDQENLRKFMQQVLDLQESDDFYESVDPMAHPNYRKIIREPMELKTMEQRVATHRYTRLAEFVADACRIFDNCKHYNQANSAICKKATTLESFFVQRLRLLRQKLLADVQ